MRVVRLALVLSAAVWPAHATLQPFGLADAQAPSTAATGPPGVSQGQVR
jgi:hypothetical protein